MTRRTHSSIQRETSIGIGILLLLAVIAWGIWRQQFHFNAAILSPDQLVSLKPLPETQSVSPFAEVLPKSLVPLSAPETFDEASLSEKIDGKAELYLSCGFKAMKSQRLALANDPSSWLELFDYEMADGDGAFSVFSRQRRSDAQPLDISPLAYRTKNAIFFAKGSHYFEIVASSAAEPVLAAILELGGRLAAKGQDNGDSLSGTELFPPENMRAGSVTLLLSDVFGFDKLDRVYIANYDLSGKKATAFLSARESSAQAGELAKVYCEFLKQNGIQEATSPALPAGMRLFDVLGSWEVIFSEGKFLGGVHEADTKESAIELAGKLMKRMKEQSR